METPCFLLLTAEALMLCSEGRITAAEDKDLQSNVAAVVIVLLGEKSILVNPCLMLARVFCSLLLAHTNHHSVPGT